MYLSSGQGRKCGGARATGATPSLAPLKIIKLNNGMCKKSKQTNILKDNCNKLVMFSFG